MTQWLKPPGILASRSSSPDMRPPPCCVSVFLQVFPLWWLDGRHCSWLKILTEHFSSRGFHGKSCACLSLAQLGHTPAPKQTTAAKAVNALIGSDWGREPALELVFTQAKRLRKNSAEKERFPVGISCPQEDDRLAEGLEHQPLTCSSPVLLADALLAVSAFLILVRASAIFYPFKNLVLALLILQLPIRLRKQMPQKQAASESSFEPDSVRVIIAQGQSGTSRSVSAVRVFLVWADGSE